MLSAGRRGPATRAGAALVLAAVVAVPLTTADGSRSTAARSSSSGLADVVVQAEAGGASAAAAAVRAVGGSVRRVLPIVHGVAASVPAGAVAGLSRRDGITAVTPDAPVRVTAASYQGAAVASSHVQTSGAEQAWAAGSTGAGVTVALLDTGVSPTPDLGDRLIPGPDFSGERNSTQDSYGHGTVMAGVVAGDGAGSRGRKAGAYVGMAPRAKVLSVKVAGRRGATDVSTVLAALQWVAAVAPRRGIRVVNLSWGTSSRQSTTLDPLNYAVEQVWRSGLVVVVGAGNRGPTAGKVDKPADDPLVITAGAYDDGGDTALGNDEVPAWSSRGPTAQGVRKPDVVAPGRTIVGTVDPRSTIAQENPGAIVAPGYIVGSGTSQAAAVTSGAVALLLSARPSLSPDQVKAALRTTAVPLGATGAAAQGAGRIDVSAALEAPPSSSRQKASATGKGSLEASRGNRHLQTTCPGESAPRAVTGEMDALCRPWAAGSWSADASDADSWTGSRRTVDSWTTDSWTSDSWTVDSWTTAFWGYRPPRGRTLPGEPSVPQAVGPAR